MIATRKRQPTTRHEAILLSARQVLQTIRQNPGITISAIRERTNLPYINEAIGILQKHHLVRFKQPSQPDGRRPQLWYPAET